MVHQQTMTEIDRSTLGGALHDASRSKELQNKVFKLVEEVEFLKNIIKNLEDK